MSKKGGKKFWELNGPLWKHLRATKLVRFQNDGQISQACVIGQLRVPSYR